MTERECRTTAEAEAAIKAGDTPVLIGDVYLSVSASIRIVTKSGKPHVVAWGSSQPHVEAWESSQPHVEAWESSQPHVVARESSQPHVEAWESSQPHVVAWESSQPHVVARGSSQPHVVARGSSQPHVEAKGCVQLHVRGSVSVMAAATVALLISGGAPKIEGGGFVQRVDRSTPAAWCAHYGVELVGDVALLGKVVRDDYLSSRGLAYTPGTTPSATDWDGGLEECGCGLHFSPAPAAAREFDSSGKRYLICPVRLSDMAVHPDGQFPQKCKASKVCAPLWEVDVRGEPLTARDRELREAFYAEHAKSAKKAPRGRKVARS